MKRVFGLLSASALAAGLLAYGAPAGAQDYGFGASSSLYAPQKSKKSIAKYRPAKVVGRSAKARNQARVVRAVKAAPVTAVAKEAPIDQVEPVGPVAKADTQAPRVRVVQADAMYLPNITESPISSRVVPRKPKTVGARKPVDGSDTGQAPAPGNSANGVDNRKDPLQLVVSLPDQKVAVYKGEQVIASSRVSTGRGSHPTPPGIFSIIQKNRVHFSNLYESAPMPFMQRITWSGLALHAGDVSRPYASHGCVRLPYSFAQTLFKRTEMGAHVIVAAGMSAPRLIEHDVLPQPGPAIVETMAENIGTQTSGNTGMVSDAATPDEADGASLVNFVPPVEAAANRLEEMKRMREEAASAIEGLEAAKVAARTALEQQRSGYEVAQQGAAEEVRRLDEAEAVAARAARRVAAERALLAKAQGRLNWSQTIVDKRRNDPRFEGDWMAGALRRLAEREAVVQAAEQKVAEARKTFEGADAARSIAADTRRKAREHAVAEGDALAAANARLREAETSLVMGKRKFVQAEAAVKRATEDLRASQQREKMPLRVVITPLTKVEQVKIAQRLLAELGYEGVEPVGHIGKLTSAAIRDVEAKLGLRQSGAVTEDLITRLHGMLGREQTTNAHLYVRQGFLDLFDLPVIIDHPDDPLGTHVFTAMHFEEGATSVAWTALTVKERGTQPVRIGKHDGAGAAAATKRTPRSAREALDRIRIPAGVRRQLSSMLTPGSSIVITDNGINSQETGKGTDFVVLTR